MLNKLKVRTEKTGCLLSEEFWNEIQGISELVSVKKNGVLINYGSQNKQVYFIVNGSFVSSIISENGDKRAVWFYLDEVFEFAICMDSYFLNELTKYELRALEDSTVMKFNKQSVDLLLLKYPLFNQLFYSDIIFDYIAINEMRAFQLVYNPLEFLDYLNKKYPALVHRISSKNMAHFLGVSPEWYSKLKKKQSLELVQDYCG